MAAMLKAVHAQEDRQAAIEKAEAVVGNFPDGNSALMFVIARLRYISTREWGTKRYMSMSLLLGGEIGYQVLDA